MRQLLSVSLLAFVMTGCFESEHGPYVRIHSAKFQVATKSFVPENGNGPKVTLLGVIHMGERGYYETIQELLNKADLVLFEETGRTDEQQELKKEVAAKCPENLDLFPGSKDPGMYAKFAKALDLVEQLTVIDYNKPHFVQADATLRHILMRNSPEGTPLCNVLTANKEFSKNAMRDQDSTFEALNKLGSETTRNGLALALSKLISGTRAESEKTQGADKFIIFDRNDIAFAALKREIPRFSASQEIAVFYGAAHLDDMEQSLKALGYKHDSTQWLSAFSL